MKDLRHCFDWRLLVFHLIYFVLLLWVYTTYIVDVYGYTGFNDALNVNKAVFAPLAIISAFVLLRNNGLPSYFFLNIIIALIVTPSLVIFSGSNLPLSFIAVTWLAFTILAIVARYFRVGRIRLTQVTATRLLFGLAVLSLLFIASIFALGGGKFINFDLSLVYRFRQDAVDNLPAIFGYLMPNFSKAVVPLGIVLSLLYRKWALLILFVFCSIMIFALSSLKQPLFIPFAIIFTYWFSLYNKVSNLTMFALIIIVIIGGIDFNLQQLGMGGLFGWFGSLMVRRSLLVPSLLNWAYYDFFSVHPYFYWADSKLSIGLVSSPYDLGIQNLIGREFMGNAEMHANTGWIGSGMANAGYFGILLYSVLIGLFLSLLDAYAKKLGYSLVLAVFLITVINATGSADFPAMLLTHGLLSLLIIVMLLKPDFKQNLSRSSCKT